MAGVEVRKVEQEYGETGVNQENRTDVEYQLGAEIDGGWVPFVTVQQGRVEMFQAQAEREREQEKQTKKDAAGKSLGN